MQRFEQLYTDNVDAIRAYVRRRAPEEMVDDVVADVFLVCWRRLDVVPEEALPWLYAVARHAPAPLRVRRLAVAAVVAAAIAIPTVAFAGRLADALGISNEGTPVSTSSVLPGQGNLDDAIRELKVGSTMQLLGTLNGVRFYA